MSKVFICAAIPDELATREEGAVAVATAIEAGDERRARAKFHWQFLEHYPAAQDCAYKFIVCEDKPGIPRPALDSWDAEYMQENRWDEESASFVPVETESDPMNVTFDKLAPEVQNAVMVKFDTCENITVDMVISAQELLQEDMATFDGHIVEALMKMPEVNAMYPELKLHAIGWVKHKCIPGAKWPEIQAEMRIWKKRREGERKETGKYTSVVDLARARANQQYTENSTGKISPVIAAIHREYKQTWKTLDDELAYALWPGDVEVIDRDTIKWWLKQSREAQSAIMTDEIPLDDALLQLREFIDENSGEFFVQVWGNGANFDNTILRRSYERQGIPCPWRYYNDRDVRTIVELGKAIDFDARTAIPFEGERHNALDDARYQAKYVSVSNAHS
ncbi:3'-5' exonuclease [Escherichia coli]|uniref:3'-5' exonuclease n=1 Tax=Escherichia coli TaxID=562 RepID=UPI002113AD16|nr:3'-5' exonuclease [Escherichia coli]MCQ6981423.1 3'-5' exoribonuclease [Escherichia coli]MCQ7043113.1 3'-5' exoribonuclease [Escherichia coli]